MDSYEKLLDKAIKELPEQTNLGDRFNLDKIIGHLEGSKTVIVNLKKIAKDLGREPDHLLKYLLRELASSGKFVREQAVFAAKLAASVINKKIKKYASEFVLCSECGKPDTNLIEEKSITYLRCQACGSKKPVKTI